MVAHLQLVMKQQYQVVVELVLSRIQVGDISGGGVDEVIVNAAGTGYEIGDTITFSSGTAEAEIAIVGGGIALETGNVAIHVELESGTISGSGSGDLLLEDHGDGTIGKFLDSLHMKQIH